MKIRQRNCGYQVQLDLTGSELKEASRVLSDYLDRINAGEIIPSYDPHHGYFVSNVSLCQINQEYGQFLIENRLPFMVEKSSIMEDDEIVRNFGLHVELVRLAFGEKWYAKAIGKKITIPRGCVGFFMAEVQDS